MTPIVSFITHFKLAVVLHLLLAPVPPKPCLGTVFGYAGDEYAGGDAVCVHRSPRPGERGVALRDAPCHARVKLTNPENGRVAYAPVVDHGPYGALIPDRRGRLKWGVKRRPGDPGEWRGCVDMWPQTAKDLRHSGFGSVIVEVLPPKAKTKR